jgi:UDP-glucose 4-epimerase
VIGAARKLTGSEIPTKTVKRREGDPAVLIASSAKIKHELGWEPEFQDLEVIIQSALSWLTAYLRPESRNAA